MIIKTLNWSYDKAINGVPGMGTAEDLANDYLKTKDSLENQIDSLISMQDIKAGTSGFLTGLGGLITLPLTLPINITSVVFVQIRMIAAIAYMCGHNIRSDQVKTLIFVCLTGNSAVDILKDIGIEAGKKIFLAQLKALSGPIIVKINQRVGLRLAAKFSEKGMINLGKTIPILGGLLGGTIDAISTHTIGKIAKKVFYK